MKKKILSTYLTEEEVSDFKKACEEQGRSMASQSKLLIQKFIFNSKRKVEKS